MTVRFCSLASGSSGNCQYIETDRVRLLVDAGLSGKKIQEALVSIEVDPSTINGILVTHEHRDHIHGIGILSRRFNIPIYTNEKTWLSMKSQIGEVKEENINIFDTDKIFEIQGLNVHPFKVSHDAIEPVGYSFYYKNVKISLVTDTGYVSEEVKENIKNSNLFLIESNHDIEMLKVGNYPWHLKKRILSEHGHLSNDDAGRLLAEILCGENECILLGHLSKENNFPELAYQTVSNILTEKGINVTKDISLEMTYRDRPSKVFCF